MKIPSLRRQPTRPSQRGLRLMHVGLVLALAFAAALLSASGVFYATWSLLAVDGLKPERRIDSQTLFDLVKLSFGVVAGAGALVALVVAYRRQRVDEDGALREATRLHTERFATAVGQLGNDSPAVRLGGVHALAGLADDAPTPELRQTCIDVLCAYLRLPYATESAHASDDENSRNAFLSLREVRHTIIRVIANRLRLDQENLHSWQGQDFDFTGVIFDGGDFTRTNFSSGRVSFINAKFIAGEIDFSGAHFSGAVVDFGGAEFSGGLVRFTGASFSDGLVGFAEADFTESKITFIAAEFCGAQVEFWSAIMSGGSLDFTNAQFARGKVGFASMTFSGGQVEFISTKFTGSDVTFDSATFSGAEVTFGLVRFLKGKVSFMKPCFVAGRVSFAGSIFLKCDVCFFEVQAMGGTVDFRSAMGNPPTGLVSSDHRELPEGFCFPEPWII